MVAFCCLVLQCVTETLKRFMTWEFCPRQKSVAPLWQAFPLSKHLSLSFWCCNVSYQGKHGMNLKDQIAECDSQMWRDHHRDLGSSSWGHIFGPWNGSTGPTCPNQSGTGLGTFLYAWNTEGLTSHFMYELNFHWAVLFGEPKLDGFRRWTWPSPFLVALVHRFQ